MQNKDMAAKRAGKYFRGGKPRQSKPPGRALDEIRPVRYLRKNILMVHVEVTRVQDDFGFEGTDDHGHRVAMDSNPESGGHNSGFRPMQMLLVALGSCSGIDIVSILKKQRQSVGEFRISIDGERATGKEATLWTQIRIVFELKGNIDPEKAQRACALSIDKYCSVAATLKAAGCRIQWECRINP
jgi:putative redox protein